MKKICANVNMNDRIVIHRIDCDTIQYLLVEARTRKEIPLGEEVPFSLSAKKYLP